MLGNGCDVRGILAPMQDAAVNFGMQRLDAAIEHLGKAGEFRNIFDGDAGIAQQLGGASGGDEFDAEGGELAREVYQAGLVGNAQDGALDTGRAGGHNRPLVCRMNAERPKILSASPRWPFGDNWSNAIVSTFEQRLYRTAGSERHLLSLQPIRRSSI